MPFLRKLSFKLKKGSKLTTGFSPQKAKQAQLFEVASGGVSGRIHDVAFNPVASLLALCTSEAEIHVFGSKGIEASYRVSQPCHSLQFLVGSPFLVATGGNLVHIIDLEKLEVNVKEMKAIITSMVTPVDTKWLFLGLESGDIVTLNASSMAMGSVAIPYPKDELSGNELAVAHMDLNVMNPGLLLASYVSDGATVLYELLPRSIFNVYRYGSIVTALAWNLSGDAFIAAYDEGKFCYWNLASTKPKYIWEAPWMHPDQGLTAIHPILGITPRLLDGSDGSDEAFLVNMGPVIRMLRLADGEITTFDELTGSKGIDKICVISKSAWWQTDAEPVTVSDDRLWEAIILLNNDGRLEARTWVDPMWGMRIPRLIPSPASLQLPHIDAIQLYATNGPVPLTTGLQLGHVLKGGKFFKSDNVVERIPRLAIRSGDFISFGDFQTDYGVLNLELQWDLDMAEIVRRESDGLEGGVFIRWWLISQDGLCLRIAVNDRVVVLYRSDSMSEAKQRQLRSDSKVMQRRHSDVASPLEEPVKSPIEILSPDSARIGAVADPQLTETQDSPSTDNPDTVEENGKGAPGDATNSQVDEQKASSKRRELRRSSTAPASVLEAEATESQATVLPENGSSAVQRSQTLHHPPLNERAAGAGQTKAIEQETGDSSLPFMQYHGRKPESDEPWIHHVSYQPRELQNCAMIFSRGDPFALVQPAEIIIFEENKVLSRMPIQITESQKATKFDVCSSFLVGTVPAGVSWAGWNDDIFTVVVGNLRAYSVALHGEQWVDTFSKKQPPVAPTMETIVDVAICPTENGFTTLMLTKKSLISMDKTLNIDGECLGATVADDGYLMVLGKNSLHLVGVPNLTLIKKLNLVQEPEHPITGSITGCWRQCSPDGFLVQWTKTGRIRLFDLNSTKRYNRNRIYEEHLVPLKPDPTRKIYDQLKKPVTSPLATGAMNLFGVLKQGLSTLAGETKPTFDIIDETELEYFLKHGKTEKEAEEEALEPTDREKLGLGPSGPSELDGDNPFMRAKNALIERGERLEQLETKFADMENRTQTFAERAREIRKRQEEKKWWQL